MAKFALDSVGNIDDRVRLELGNDEVMIAESYDVKVSVFSQPATFSLRLGNASVAAKIIHRYPPRTPFKLYIGGVLQQTGETDGPASKGTGGTNVTIKGRDLLQRLHDDHVDADFTFKDGTYLSLAKRQLEIVGLGKSTLFSTNRANRQIRSGVHLAELAPPRTVDQIVTGAAAPPGSTGESTLVHQQIQAKLNETRYDFLLRYLQLAGLFFWAAADGSFVISEPNANQKPMAAIIRRVGQTRLETNVVDHDFTNDTTHRFAEYSIAARGTGGKNGHPKALGSFVDDEMFNWGFSKKKIWRSQNARTKAQAEFLARRMAAEDRRNGWRLSYTLSGHTTPFATSGERAVWTPDSVVRVEDEILGISGLFYVGECSYKRSPHTTTEISLLRPQDLVFGPAEF